MDLDDARKLFFDYDGSRFYMSRDGVESSYEEACVPREVEATWLEELTRDKLGLLAREGNWAVLHFLNHHSDFRHLAEILSARPLGMMWQKCAFLEKLLAYARSVGRVGGDRPLVAQAARKAVVEAERLLKRARSAESIARVRGVLAEARLMIDQTEAG